MARRSRNKGREVNGILLLDKPIGLSSNQALQRVKRLFKARKAGHTGSLDPLATGLLPLCFGSATKISAFLLDADKQYQVGIKLGVTTTTADAEGEILQLRSADHISDQDIVDVLPEFCGLIDQIPPMHSALKVNGQRLYKLAREGIEVERPARQVRIDKLEFVSRQGDEFKLEVACSKGTYVRTLAEDIGEALGCGAHVVALRRAVVGPYKEADSVTLEELEAIAEQGVEKLDKRLVGADTALQDWPAVRLNSDSAYYLKLGQPVMVPKTPLEGQVRIYTDADQFLGVGEIDDNGRVAPKRLF
jgi:tRNA pseudouridine55 synthase